MTDQGSGPLSIRGIERTDLKFDLQLESLARKKKTLIITGAVKLWLIRQKFSSYHWK